MSVVRSIFVVFFLFLGIVLTILANSTVWANRTVFNTDNFVETTNRVLDEEEVQQQLATRLSVRLIEQGEVEERLSERLPDGLSFMAPILTATAQDLAYDAILRALNNDTIRGGLDTSLRLVHAQLLKIIEDEGAIVVQDNQIILDLQVVLRAAAEELGASDDGLLSNITIPEDAGQIVLVEDAETAGAAKDLLAYHDQITWLIIGAAVVAFVLAIAVSRERRSTARSVGMLIIIAGLLGVLVLVPLRPIAAAVAQNQQAAQATFDAFFLDYRIQSLVLMLVGAVVMLGVALTGQGELARAVRGARGKAAGTPTMLDAVRSNATTFRVVGLITGTLVLIVWPSPSDRVYINTFVLLALYFGALWVATGMGSWAQWCRARISDVFDAAGGGTEGRNASFFGRNAAILRFGGIALAVVCALALPNVGWGALAGIVAITLAYLALVDWLATKEA